MVHMTQLKRIVPILLLTQVLTQSCAKLIAQSPELGLSSADSAIGEVVIDSADSNGAQANVTARVIELSCVASNNIEQVILPIYDYLGSTTVLSYDDSVAARMLIQTTIAPRNPQFQYLPSQRKFSGFDNWQINYTIQNPNQSTPAKCWSALRQTSAGNLIFSPQVLFHQNDPLCGSEAPLPVTKVLNELKKISILDAVPERIIDSIDFDPNGRLERCAQGNDGSNGRRIYDWVAIYRASESHYCSDVSGGQARVVLQFSAAMPIVDPNAPPTPPNPPGDGNTVVQVQALSSFNMFCSD